MNAHCHKVIFSKRLGTLVAVGEHTASTGKAASGQGCRGSVVASGFVGALRFTCASVALACLSLGNTQAQSSQIALATNALPQGGSVSTGSATISTSGANMAINQSTDKASINWQSFNIGTGASVNIAQPSSSAVLLNRVVGNDPSQILGQLKANGQVILLNPNGVLFGKDGSVTASAFTASTFGLSDADFMAGYYKYNRNGSTAAVVNQGTIEASAGGFVALIGAAVTNEGTIRAPQGDVVMAAAESVALPEELVKPQPVNTPNTVSVRMSKRVRLELDPAAINTAVNNTESGVIVTEGGQVLLQAAALSSAVASVTHSGRIDTSAPQAGAVTVLADNGVIKVDGSIKANSSSTDDQGQARKGGDIIIGRDIDTGVLAKTADVSGAVLESDKGFVETSGEYLVTQGVKVKSTDWLLDPNNIEINLTNTAVTAGNSVVLAGDIAAALDAGTNVTIATGNGVGSTSSATGVSEATPGTGNSATGTIAVNSAITSSYSGASNPTLKLSAASNITVSAAINTSGSNVHLLSTGGAITTTAAITARNVSIDNTGGTIDASTGVITKGASTGTSATGISVGANITATGNLNMYGLSTSGYGINVLGNKALSGGNIQAIGQTTNGAYGVHFNGSNSVITTGSSGDSLIKGMTTAGGTNALLAWGGLGLTAASGTTLTLWGDGKSTGDRAARFDGGASATGAVTLKGTSNNTTALLLINGGITANSNSNLTLSGITSASGAQGIYTVNGGGVGLSNGATLNVIGQNTNAGGNGIGLLLQGSGIYKVGGATSTGTVTITGSTSSSSGSRALALQSTVATDGDINIEGTVANASSTAVEITGAITSSGANRTISITGSHGISHTGSIKTTSSTGTGTNINLTSTNAGITGTGTIGDTTNKNASVKLTTATTSTFSGGINASNFTKAGLGSLTLDSWAQTPSVLTNISNAYTVKDGGSLTISTLGLNYPQLNPASVNVENASTFSLNSNSNGFWKNTAFNFTGGLGGGTLNLLGNPIGASSTTNTFTTSGGVTNTVTGVLNANSANVNLTLTAATSGTTLSDGSYAALAFTTNVQGGYGIDNASTITISGGGGVLFKDKIRATTLNINAGTLQMGDGSAITAATTPDLNATNVAIASGAKLVFNRPDTHTNTSTISGAGELVKTGSGTTILTGNSTLSGTTTINAGTLQIGNGGASGALGNGAIVNNASLSISRDNTIDLTFANAISGSGSLTKSGNGKVILTGTNTYGGTTTISAGSLQIGDGNTTGTLGSGSVVDNGTLIFSRSDDLTIANAISGTGSIEQAGTGTTTFTANNTYSGTTTISAGTLQIGNGSSTGSLGSGAVVDNSHLAFNHSDDVSVSNAISGTGNLSQIGSGKVTLTGNNTYSGTTAISAGTLQIGSGGTSGTVGTGAISNNSALIFDRSDDLTIGGIISGTGDVTQAGTGTTILTADNTYSGTTTISAGTLQIGNDTTTGTLGTGAVINNATLEFKRSANTLISNNITGTGDLVATLSAGGLKFSGDVALDGDIDLTASHATDWHGIQLSGNLSAAGDINLTGASSTRYGILIDAFKNIQTTGNAPQSVVMTGDAANLSTAGIAIIGAVNTQNGSSLLATGTNTGGGIGIYNELTTGGTNYGKIGSTTSGDITLVGTSSGGSAATVINTNLALNQGHALLLRGDITSKGHISLTGTADHGLGVFLQHSTYDYGRTMAEAQPTIQVVSGGANMAGQNAISINGTNLGSNQFNNNGVLIGSKIINNSTGGATTITSQEGGVALVTSTTGSTTGSGSINNASTAGAITITAGDGTATSTASIGNLPSGISIGNTVTRAWTLSAAGTQITQNSNAGVTITSDGLGNVTPAKIVNNGTGDVVIGAGVQIAAGTATGGNVHTASGNTITQASTGKTYIYTGSASGTGALANLSSNFNTLFYAGNTGTINTAFNKAYNSTIAGGPNSQALFRQAKGPSYALSFNNLSKTYGDVDPANLNATFLADYLATGGGTNISQAIAGTGGSNTFEAKTADIFNDLTITRAAGADAGTYAYTMTGNTLINSITGSTSLVIGKRNITLTGITASNKTYDGSTAATVTSGTFSNLVAGEALLLSGVGAFSDANVGNGKTVTANAALLNKADSTGKWANYNLTTSGNVTGLANITPAVLTIAVNGSSAFVTQDPNSAFNQGFSYSGFVNGETASTALTTLPTRTYIGAANPSVGTYANVYDLTAIPQAAHGNYTITVQKGTLNVVAADALMLTVASQSQVYGALTAANEAVPAQGTVTAQYCLVQANCNGGNLVNLNLRKDTTTPNQWIISDNTSSTVQFGLALTGASYSTGGFVQVGNYDYSLSAASPMVIGTQNFNTVVANTGSLGVTPLAVTLQTTPVTKTYDGNTTLPSTTLRVSNTAASDDLQVSFIAGEFGSSAVSSAAAFSLYGVTLAGNDVANYSMANYTNSTYLGTGSITKSGGGNNTNPQPIHPPKPIIPTNNSGESGGGESGGSSASNPYLLVPNNRNNSADRCTPNTLEDCLCETQEPKPVEGLAICYQPKKTAGTRSNSKAKQS